MLSHYWQYTLNKHANRRQYTHGFFLHTHACMVVLGISDCLHDRPTSERMHPASCDIEIWYLSHNVVLPFEQGLDTHSASGTHRCAYAHQSLVTRMTRHIPSNDQSKVTLHHTHIRMVSFGCIVCFLVYGTYQSEKKQNQH